MTTPLLSVNNLRIGFGSGNRWHDVVNGIDFDVRPGEILAIVGESGSGKSVTAMSLLDLLPRGTSRIMQGKAMFEGRDLLALPDNALRQLRGRKIGMVFQEPMTSLNPVLTIGTQMTEAMVVHGVATRHEADRRAIEMLGHVGIPAPETRLRQYPHEFSGGMRQRVMIAMAMLLKPALLIADEPTTALDVTIQAQIIDLMKALVRETGVSMIFITHDMGVVAECADRVLVMQRGRIVEQADVKQLFSAPRETYTRALLAAVPRLDGDGFAVPVAGAKAPVVRVDAVSKTFSGGGAFFSSGRSETRALDDVSLDIGLGETIAVVGESGSGKSTLGRVIARLTDADSGSVFVDGEEITRLRGAALRRVRSKVQMIFQDPYSSLDPRFPVGRTIAEPLRIHKRMTAAAAREAAEELLVKVGLDAAMARRLPHEFSGGQRQRIAIARALAADPAIIVADEPTSALDVSIQAQVLDLLAKLRDERGIALMFISHDLAVVRKISSRVAVMRSGRIVEMGPTETVLSDPGHPYTEALLSAAPLPDPAQRGRPRLPVPAGGCASGRLVEMASGHWVAQ